jgi:CTD small phosphatase-like protein 2
MTEFLDKLSRKFQLVIFTASRQDYADIIINRIDPENKFISHRLYRQHCDLVDGQLANARKDFHVKSLKIVANHKKEDLLIIDNLVYSYAFDLENGIPIKPYINGKNDFELEYLAEALADLKSFMDSRTYIRDKLKLEELYNYLSNAY